MKVNDSNLNSLASTGIPATQETGRTGQNTRSGQAGGASSSTSDDVHLSELVKSLRSLAADSPERQAKLESLARAYADGTHTVDAGATASGIIDDALGN